MYGRLRDLREDHDMTQKQIAQMLGMSQTGYSKYETGENDIPTAVLIKLADFYKTSTDYLLGIDSSLSVDISKLNDKEKTYVYNLISIFLDSQEK